MSHLFTKTFLILSLAGIIGAITWVSPNHQSRAAGNTYYVAMTGDNNRGCGDAQDINTPKQTINAGVRCLSPGDTLIVRDGTYDPISIDCSSSINDGTASAPITLKAENERKAQLGSSGAQVFQITSCSYWIIEGLHLKQRDHDDNVRDGTGAALIARASSNLTFRRNLIQGADRYECDSSFILNSTSNSLVEENEVYEYHRHGIQVQSYGGNNVIRRNYVNSRGLADASSGLSPCVTVDQGQGDHGVIAYSGHDNIIENNIVENTNTGFESISAKSVADSGNNRFYGNIARKTNSGISWVPKDPFEIVGPTNNIAVNFVSIDNSNVAVWPRAGFNNRCDNCTVIGDLSTAFKADTTACTGPDCPYPRTDFSFYGTNNLALRSSGAGFSISDQTGGWGLDYVNTFTHATAYNPASSPNLTNNTTVDPQLGACKVFIPNSSPMKRAGKGGADIGANVLYAYENGTLTQKPLWEPGTGRFPCGAIIPGVNDISGQSCFDVHKRLNVNQNGCNLPSDYKGSWPPGPGGIGSGGGVTPSPSPTPSFTFTAWPTSITAGGTSQLSWSSPSSSCTASGGWSGIKNNEGSIIVTPTVTTTYTLACGSQTKSVTVTVGETGYCNLYGSTSSIPAGYGVPWDVFHAQKPLLITIYCEEGGAATLTLNPTPNPEYPYRYSYENAYYAAQGASSWTRISLLGANKTGTWFPSKATAVFSPSQDTTTYTIGYICTWNGSKWLCGCRDRSCTQSYWQLQGVKQ